MKRYDRVLCYGRCVPDGEEYETPIGSWVKYADAKAEIEALKHQRDQAVEAVQQLSAGQTITQVAEGHLIQNMQREIEALKKEIAELHGSISAIHNEYRSDVQDAERYRLAKKHNPQLLVQIAWGISPQAHPYSVEQVDAAFDAAMEQDDT